MQKVNITTEDNVELSALLWDEDAFKSVLLIHMMPSQKESWVPLGDRLAGLGFNVLAIDLRGHGESGGGDYKTFTSEQHHDYFKDQKAAVEFLMACFPHTEIYMGGASIGANMAIRWMAQHPDVSRAVALSAGLDYHGVRAIDDIKNLVEDQQVLLVGARDDVRSNGSDCGTMAEQLFAEGEGVLEKIVYDTGGHGTDMWNEHPELIEEIIKFYSE